VFEVVLGSHVSVLCRRGGNTREIKGTQRNKAKTITMNIADNELSPALEEVNGLTAADRLHVENNERLSGHQKDLMDLLVEKDPKLGKIYQGVLLILEDKVNPTYLAFAAYGMRELMDQLTKYYTVPLQEHEDTVRVDQTDKVRDVETAWLNMLKGTKNHVSGQWTGEIDGHLMVFLDKMKKFFDWFTKDKPRMRDKIKQSISQMRVNPQSMPSAIEDHIYDFWNNSVRYFNWVLHYNKETTEAEIIQYIESIERFLLDTMKPATAKDLDTLDALIREGEKDG
jgi:hypothetical protein